MAASVVPELALGDAELMAESQHLSSETAPERLRTRRSSDKRLGEAEEHGPDHARPADLSAEGPASVLSKVTASRGPGCSDRIDSGGLTSHLAIPAVIGSA